MNKSRWSNPLNPLNPPNPSQRREPSIKPDRTPPAKPLFTPPEPEKRMERAPVRH